MTKTLTIAFSVIACASSAQDLTEMKLTAEDSIEKVQHHYRRDSPYELTRVIDLKLKADGTYNFFVSAHIDYIFSTGHWKKANGIILLNSDIQNDNLPIKVTYRQRDSSDFNVKKIAFLKDLTGQQATYAHINVNNDSTLCDDGDLICIGFYQNIDSIRVETGMSRIRSKWVRISPNDGLIQVTIQVSQNLDHYEVMTNQRFRIDKLLLKPY